MSTKRKKVKLRTDRILVLVIMLAILVLLIVLIAKGVSSKNGQSQTVGGDIQDISSTTTEVTSQDTLSTTQDVTETSQVNHTIEVIDGCTYIDGILIINKSYSVPAEYQGYNGGLDDTKPTPPQGLFPEVIESFNQMQEDALNEGLDIYIASGYRSYYYQLKVYNSYCETDSPEIVDTYSARAGHSEHQSGYAFDLNSIDDSFADTLEGQWVAENCYKYGFIIRFPEGKEDITGYQYESWHLRYVGVDVATYIYENNLCLEEYLGVDSVYAD
ncbi:MAG: M15 family metallopeptidase [Ruminococcus sp.]|nr:M15 family metallopeptidase [Ruminococcus sp.]